jgi:hypothetical protein
MSLVYPGKLLFAHNDVTVQAYQGPDPGYSWADRPATGDATRYALNAGGSIVTFSRVQWETLAEYFAADCSPDCEGPRLDKPLPQTWRWKDTR